MELIDKAAVVSEIERRIKVCQDYAKCNLTENTRIGNHAQQLELKEILSFLNTLEVKEIDLEEEIDLYIENSLTGTNPIYTKGAVSNLIDKAAKYFFELGLKAKEK